MYRKNNMSNGTLKRHKTYEGETIEQKVYRVTVNKEPIKDGAPRVYTERKDGVLPDYNIRTDRWDAAIDATDYISKSKVAKREQTLGEKTFDTMTPEQQKAFKEKFPNSKVSGGESTQGTDSK